MSVEQQLARLYVATVRVMHQFSEVDLLDATLTSQRRRLFRKLDRVEQAVVRWQEGRFGICVVCDRPIASQRLKLIPEASRCLACQKSAERTFNADNNIRKPHEKF